MTKILILYYSKTGNTQRMAKAIAEGARTVSGVEVTLTEEIEPEILSKFDAIIVGAPTYYHDMPLKIKKFLERIEDAKVNLEGKIGAAFGSYGWSREGPERAIEVMKNKFGMRILTQPLLIKYSPDEEGLRLCRNFGMEIAKKIVNLTGNS